MERDPIQDIAGSMDDDYGPMPDDEGMESLGTGEEMADEAAGPTLSDVMDKLNSLEDLIRGKMADELDLGEGEAGLDMGMEEDAGEEDDLMF